MGVAGGTWEQAAPGVVVGAVARGGQSIARVDDRGDGEGRCWLHWEGETGVPADDGVRVAAGIVGLVGARACWLGCISGEVRAGAGCERVARIKTGTERANALGLGCDSWPVQNRREDAVPQSLSAGCV